MIEAGGRGQPPDFGEIVMPVSIVAALQIGSLPGGKGETLAQILGYEEEITRSGAQLVVMPEALLGGYPKGEGFGTQLGYRLPEGREAFARYFANAIDVPGAQTRSHFDQCWVSCICALACFTTCSTVNPNFSCSLDNGADAPKLFITTLAPVCPT